MTTAYPLSWPSWVPRTLAHQRKQASFSQQDWRAGRRQRLSVADAIGRLDKQVDLLRARTVVLSTNVELRLNGQPRSSQPEPADPGAALYFDLKGKSICLPCDRWNRVADNIAAIAAHIEALRGQERWGVGTVEQAFAGFVALPAPKAWWDVLGVTPDDPAARVEEAYKALARRWHPDNGGSHERMAEVNAAIAEARRAAEKVG